jgi:hypothetical protein
MNTLAIRAQIRQDGTETEKKLASLLFDDDTQLLNTFQLNQMASLSYEQETCEQMFDLLEHVMRKPLESSVLTVQKSLFITKHLLIYGSEKCVNSCWGLSSHVEELQEYNTVLWQQKEKGLGAWWHSVKGGSVDKGFPVREAAKDLYSLLQNSNKIQQMRHDHADPNSLVPVGATDKVAFISDEVRHFMLQKRMEQHLLLHTKSNLVKAEGGFGSGFVGKNGETVVGAAHSLEEMMARAQREQKKFSDTGPIHYKPKAPAAPKKIAVTKKDELQGPVDLLDFSEPATTQGVAQQIDLLDLGASKAAAPVPPAEKEVLDIFAPSNSIPHDLLGSVPSTDGSELLSMGVINQTSELLNLMTIPVDENPAISDPLAILLNGGLGVMRTDNVSSAVPASSPAEEAIKSGVMSSNVDRFAALDALAPPPEVLKAGLILSGKEAENRILGFTSSMSTNTVSDEVPNVYPLDQPSSIAMAEMSSVPPPPPSEPPPPPPHSGLPQAPPDDTALAPMGGEAILLSPAMMEYGLGSTPMDASLNIAAPPPLSAPPPPPLVSLTIPPSTMAPTVDPSAIGIAERFGRVEPEDDGFVMGGTAGSGLATMPAMPPPPPPQTGELF